MTKKFRVTVEELTESDEPASTWAAIRRYEQTVDVIDLRAVVAAINHKPRAPRQKKQLASS